MTDNELLKQLDEIRKLIQENKWIEFVKIIIVLLVATLAPIVVELFKERINKKRIKESLYGKIYGKAEEFKQYAYIFEEASFFYHYYRKGHEFGDAKSEEPRDKFLKITEDLRIPYIQVKSEFWELIAEFSLYAKVKNQIFDNAVEKLRAVDHSDFSNLLSMDRQEYKTIDPWDKKQEIKKNLNENTFARFINEIVSLIKKDFA